MGEIEEQVILSGDRRWRSARSVLRLIEKHPAALWHIGDCPSGLDDMAWAMLVALRLPNIRYLADWDRYRPTEPKKKNPAGAIRNHEMVDSALMIAEATSTPVACYGFHSDIARS